jgi:glutamate-ammonia-ligase adenylyltransferase
MVRDATTRLLRVFGASTGLGEFLCRHPEQLDVLATPLRAPLSPAAYRDDLLAAVVGLTGEAAWDALRVRYRRHVTALTAYDLGLDDPLTGVADVTAALADLAGAALEASLAAARTIVPFAPDDIAATQLAIIGMGKAGARELNYVSDVDVIFVVDGDDTIEVGRAVEVGTPARGHDDARHHGPRVRARPSGRSTRISGQRARAGALVRTLDSHLAYYERWAKGWEFQGAPQGAAPGRRRRTRAALRGGDHAVRLAELLA